MTLYTDGKPREAVAREMFEARWPTGSWSSISDAERSMWMSRAELGFIASEGLDAIHAEEDANGEPRSSVVPGAGR